MGTEKKPLEVDDVAKRNPDVDRGQLEDAQDAMRELRDNGIRPRKYNVLSPYQARPVKRLRKQ